MHVIATNKLSGSTAIRYVYTCSNHMHMIAIQKEFLVPIFVDCQTCGGADVNEALKLDEVTDLNLATDCLPG